MKQRCVFVWAMCLVGLSGIIGEAFSYDARHVNAKAVSVQWRFTKWFYSGGNCCECQESQVYDGSILVYTIRNGAVTHTDTIYAREQGLAQYANFDLTGTRVAFFRKNTAPQGPNGAGNCVTVNGGKNYVSVINADGTGLRNLCELPSAPGRDVALDWPAGEWIYYVRPKSNGDKSAIIWKVNVETGATQQVSDRSSSEPDGYRRFSLNVNGTVMGIQNSIFTFPAGSYICSHPACNLAISPSGYIGTYFAGWHDELFINGTDPSKPHPDGFSGRCGIDIASPTLSELSSWGASVGSGCEHIGWAVNSDKWVLQEVGWVGHADQLAFGGNQVVANWVDQVAITISKNPRPTASQLDNANQPLGIAWNNATGDMWIDDPVNNPNANKYEDLAGVWHTVSGATALDRAVIGSCSMQSARIQYHGKGRSLAIRADSHEAWILLVVDMKGRTILQAAARGMARIPLGRLESGTYAALMSTDTGTHQANLVIQ